MNNDNNKKDNNNNDNKPPINFLNTPILMYIPRKKGKGQQPIFSSFTKFSSSKQSHIQILYLQCFWFYRIEFSQFQE